MATTPEDIGRRLRAARENLNYSLDDLAETCGLTVDEIAGIEAGTSPKSDHAARIAASLGVTLS